MSGLRCIEYHWIDEIREGRGDLVGGVDRTHGQGRGREGLKLRVAKIRAAFQPRHELHDVIVEADRVAVYWTLSGVHSAVFLGLTPTGKQVEFDGVDMYAMRDGRMAAHWNVVDMWAFYRQVGGPTHK